MTRNPARAWRAIFITFVLAGLATNCSAASLLEFTFDDNEGFTLTPEFSVAAINSTAFSVDHGNLTHYQGTSGRALAASQFEQSNRLSLDIEFDNSVLELSELSLSHRRSASGPTSWMMEINGLNVASGVTPPAFETVFVPLDLVLPVSAVTISTIGWGASSPLGTYRIDDLMLRGNFQPVPLPAPMWLLAVPLMTLVFRRRQQRPIR